MIYTTKIIVYEMDTINHEACVAVLSAALCAYQTRRHRIYAWFVFDFFNSLLVVDGSFPTFDQFFTRQPFGDCGVLHETVHAC